MLTVFLLNECDLQNDNVCTYHILKHLLIFPNRSHICVLLCSHLICVSSLIIANFKDDTNLHHFNVSKHKDLK